MCTLEKMRKKVKGGNGNSRGVANKLILGKRDWPNPNGERNIPKKKPERGGKGKDRTAAWSKTGRMRG